MLIIIIRGSMLSMGPSFCIIMTIMSMVVWSMGCGGCGGKLGGGTLGLGLGKALVMETRLRRTRAATSEIMVN